MNCRNWECGVVVPVPVKEQSISNMQIFEGVVPVPMVTPGEEYGQKRPWFFEEV
jgi:hypothetical protein